MKFSKISLRAILVPIFIFAAIYCAHISVEARFKSPPKTEPKPKPKPPRLNVEGLPLLTDVLNELNLSSYLRKFIEIGVTETRLLLRLSAMDFNIMSFDWNMPDSDIARLKEHVAELIVKATIPEVDESDLKAYEERKKLSYGRLYIHDSVQSFEYVQASFGCHPPIGLLQIVFSEPEDGCPGVFGSTVVSTGTNTDTGADAGAAGSSGHQEVLKKTVLAADLTGKVLIVKRGQCTFLEKAQYALAANASALIIVNTEDRLESPSSGAGVEKSITYDMVKGIDQKLSVISVANTTWAKLKYSAALSSIKTSSCSSSSDDKGTAVSSSTVSLSIVPLKCGAGGACVPLVKEEISLQPEVSAGSIRVKSSNGVVKSFEFLTSIFGGKLPANQPIRIIPSAEPRDACDPIKSVSDIDAETETDTEFRVSGGFEGEQRIVGSTLEPGETLEFTVVGASSVYGKKSKTEGAGITAIVVTRGRCQFDVKAKHVQDAGAQMMIVYDPQDGPLQRLGGSYPLAGHVGIPSIMTSLSFGEFLKSHSYNRGFGGSSATFTAEITPSRDNTAFQRWTDVAYTTWVEDTDGLLMQIQTLSQKYAEEGSPEIVAWLRRKADRVRDSKYKPVTTDEL